MRIARFNSHLYWRMSKCVCVCVCVCVRVQGGVCLRGGVVYTHPETQRQTHPLDPEADTSPAVNWMTDRQL